MNSSRAKEHPEIVDWISSTINQNTKVLDPKDLIEPNEVHKLIQNCYNLRDEAFIALLWETGARIGEIIDLDQSDFDTEYIHGVKVTLSNEKNSGHYRHRTLPLHTSADYIQRYSKDKRGADKEDPFLINWEKQSHTREDNRITYNNIQRILKTVFDRAEIDKPNNPHHFRDSRATYLAQRFTEPELRKWFGWSKNSNMPSRYVHLINEDLEDALADLHGLSRDKKRTKPICS